MAANKGGDTKQGLIIALVCFIVLSLGLGIAAYYGYADNAGDRAKAKEAEAKGVDMLDAPVSGGEAGAINATLSIMVGGSEDAFTRALPIFQALGKNIVHIGDAGAGQVTKAANQVVAR